MISSDEADALAFSYMKTMETDIGVPVSLVEGSRIELEDGWVYFYNSTEYLLGGSERSALFGNSPFIVDANDGAILELGTYSSVNASLERLGRIRKSSK